MIDPPQALGITVYVMMTMEVPYEFRDMAKALQDMLDRKWDWPSDKMRAPPSEDLKTFTTSMLEPDVTKRTTMPGLIAHKWMAAEYKKAQALANKK